MDLVIDLVDEYVPFVDQFYMDNFGWERSNDWRRYWSLLVVLIIGGYALYFIFAGLSWLLFFDKKFRQHKKFIPGQEFLEMKLALWAIPTMAVFSAPCFWAEGYSSWSKLYDSSDYPVDPNSFQGFFYGIPYNFLTICWFLFSTDFGVYWIHRYLHHPYLYFLHKPHHRWLVSTPFASHAFHPIDGFAQSLPYHIYTFIFPIERKLYLCLFMFVNFWTISIHDNATAYHGKIINGAEHHNIHHRMFNYNYGQYFTLWDRLCGTHLLVDPDAPQASDEAKKNN